jgi:diketogulonate reductase-like aldo/keto reductase
VYQPLSYRCLTRSATRFYQKPCAQYILAALKHGFRYIDTAEMYDSEESVGEALSEWEGKKEGVYITTKCEWDL